MHFSTFGDICEFEYIRVKVADTYTPCKISDKTPKQTLSLNCLEDVKGLAKGIQVYFEFADSYVYGLAVFSEIVESEKGHELYIICAVTEDYYYFKENIELNRYNLKPEIVFRELEYIEPLSLYGSDRKLNKVKDIYRFNILVEEKEEYTQEKIYNETKESLKPCPFCGEIPKFQVNFEVISGAKKHKARVFCDNRLSCHVCPETSFYDGNFETVCKMVSNNWNTRKED